MSHLWRQWTKPKIWEVWPDTGTATLQQALTWHRDGNTAASTDLTQGRQHCNKLWPDTGTATLQQALTWHRDGNTAASSTKIGAHLCKYMYVSSTELLFQYADGVNWRKKLALFPDLHHHKPYTRICSSLSDVCKLVLYSQTIIVDKQMRVLYFKINLKFIYFNYRRCWMNTFLKHHFHALLKYAFIYIWV